MYEFLRVSAFSPVNITKYYGPKDTKSRPRIWTANYFKLEGLFCHTTGACVAKNPDNHDMYTVCQKKYTTGLHLQHTGLYTE